MRSTISMDIKRTYLLGSSQIAFSVGLRIVFSVLSAESTDLTDLWSNRLWTFSQPSKPQFRFLELLIRWLPFSHEKHNFFSFISFSDHLWTFFESFTLPKMNTVLQWALVSVFLSLSTTSESRLPPFRSLFLKFHGTHGDRICSFLYCSKAAYAQLSPLATKCSSSSS